MPHDPVSMGSWFSKLKPSWNKFTLSFKVVFIKLFFCSCQGQFPLALALWETPWDDLASGAEGPRGDEGPRLDEVPGFIWVLMVAVRHSGCGRRLRL